MAPKAGVPKKKKAKPKLTDKEQSDRFKETARILRSDETGRVFEEAFKKIAKPPTSKTSPKSR
jgi:hypothetical protein